jgi:putative tryptophan/tyrosine transport system substrate-binding protein
MRRREFVFLFGGVAAGWPLAVRAQQPMPVIGVLEAVSLPSDYTAAFRQGLAEAGLVEGRNVTIQERSAEGQYDRLPALAAELVRDRVAAILATTPVAALAAKAATTAIPIVFEVGSDPVKDGLVTSLARPGGNVTGVTFFANLLTAKRLELLHDIVPGAAVVGFLFNPTNANAELELKEAETAAQTLGLRLVVAKATNVETIDDAFAEFVRQQIAALLIAGDAYLNVGRIRQIAALALRHAIATCGAVRSAVAGGVLVSYGANRSESLRQAGIYAGRVLKGEKPADLPVVQPTKFEIAINLATAKALDLSINRELLLRADEVIE